MLILSEFDIRFRVPYETAMIAMLHLHPSLHVRLRSGNELLAESFSSGAYGAGEAPEGKLVVPLYRLHR